MRIFCILLFALVLSGCAVKNPDQSVIPTEELKIDPQALTECEQPSLEPERETSESGVLGILANLLNLLDACSDKHQVLVNAVKSVNTNTNIDNPQPGVK